MGWACILFLLTALSSTKGDLRCYCNEANCISTAYMCKSPSGTCYSRIPYDGQSGSSIHGCAESLPVEERAACGGDGELRPHGDPHSEWPILLCCSDDMCNYSDSLDIKIYVNSKSTSARNSIKGDGLRPRGGASDGSAGDHHRRAYTPVSDSYSHRLVWFKAAVIAVPIAGGVILVLLVLLAVRMLRNDNRRHRQLLQMRRHRSLTKAQLYVADHFYPEKGGGGAGGLYAGAGGLYAGGKHAHWGRLDVPGGGLGCPGVGVGVGRGGVVYEDVSVKVDYNGHGYKKMASCNTSQHSSGSCGSVIVWGKSEKAEPMLTVV